MRRAKIVGISVAAVAVAALTASLGFVAGMVVSPEQRAAMASPPPVTVATAQVERRVLNQTTVARGVLRFPSQRTVALPSEAGVVTHTSVKAGKKVKAGSVLLEINGHPVVAFTSPFPPFRDLKPGDSGRDVQVVKTALREMKLSVSRYSTLQSSELSSLNRFFQELGYRLPTSATECPAAPEGTEDSKPCTPTKTLTLPASWWTGIADLPAIVASPGPRVGASVGASDAALTVSGGGLALDVTFPGETIDVVPGSRLAFASDSDQTWDWTVASAKPLDQDDAGGAQIRIRTTDTIEATLVDVTGKVTFGSTEPTESLAVPLTALVAGTSGEVVVRVVGADGRQEEVPVEVGVQADGWAAVTDASGRLAEGLEVVLG